VVYYGIPNIAPINTEVGMQAFNKNEIYICMRMN